MSLCPLCLSHEAVGEICIFSMRIELTASVGTGSDFSSSAYSKLWKPTSLRSVSSHRSSGLVNVEEQALQDFCGVDTSRMAVVLTILTPELGRNVYIIGF